MLDSGVVVAESRLLELIAKQRLVAAQELFSQPPRNAQ